MWFVAKQQTWSACQRSVLTAFLVKKLGRNVSSRPDWVTSDCISMHAVPARVCVCVCVASGAAGCLAVCRSQGSCRLHTAVHGAGISSALIWACLDLPSLSACCPEKRSYLDMKYDPKTYLCSRKVLCKAFKTCDLWLLAVVLNQRRKSTLETCFVFFI